MLTHLRPIARPLVGALRTYATRPSPPTASPFARRLLIGATAISIAGLVASQRDSARNESASASASGRATTSTSGKAAGVKRAEGVGKPVYELESAAPAASSSSPAPEIVQKKEAEAVESTEAAAAASDAVGGDEAAAPAANQGAFNEETGEINWDCPCLGGMADGPCGEQFKAAFSCFVYSEAEPKGVDCVEKFRAMQDCFRLHPDIYGEEIDDDDDEPLPSNGEGDADVHAATVAAVAADTPASNEDVGAVDVITKPTTAPPVRAGDSA